jgi:hypothetical protein
MFEFFIHEFGLDFGAAVGGALAGVAIYGLKKAWEVIAKHKVARARKESEMVLPNLIKKDIGVYRDLTELMIQTKADRAFVIQFHNGTYYVNKANQMKMSCTHEIVKEGISREQENMQDVLLSRTPIVAIDLLSKPYVFINTKEQDSYFSQLLRNQGVTECVMAIMKDENIAEGFIGASFISEIEDSKTEIGKVVAQFASKIGFTLRKSDTDENVA